MSQLFSWLLFSLVMVHSLVWAAGAVSLTHRNSPDIRRCNPCPLTPGNQPPFLFGYGPLQVKGQYQSNFQIMLNKSRFNIATGKMDMVEPFPFYQMKFLPDYGLDTYGIPSSQGRSNSSYHYFSHQRDLFHYLGHFPQLSYDRERKLFTASEKDGSHYRSSFYRLKENQLLPVRVPKTKFEGGAPAPQSAMGAKGSSNNSDLSLSSLLKSRFPQARTFKVKARDGIFLASSKVDNVPEFLPPLVSIDGGESFIGKRSSDENQYLADSTSNAKSNGNTPVLAQSNVDSAALLSREIDRLLSPPRKDACVISDSVGVSREDEQLKSTINCALNQIYRPVSLARRRLLQFIVPGLEQRFRLYGVNSSIQKSHLLAQMMYESAGFVATAEGQLAEEPWQEVLNGSINEDDCSEKYAKAIKSDKIHLDKYKHESKNAYKATYRGRGLIQLTHCYNYVAFFRHKAALEKLSELNLSADDREKFEAISQDDKYLRQQDFCQATSSKDSCNVSFCSSSQLKNMANHLKRTEGLEIKPPELIADFEKTVDILAAPCRVNRVSAMTSKEFIIDSSLWYWQRCQKKYSDYIDNNSDKAVQYMSTCVHGEKGYFELENTDSLCANQNPSKSLAGIERSYCGRRKLFLALSSCFNKTSFARKNASSAKSVGVKDPP